MPLLLVRHHALENAKKPCKVHSLGLAVEEKRFYRDCQCPIWVEGTDDSGQYYRESLRTRDWAAAEAKFRAAVTDGKDAEVHGPTIKECVQRYIDSRKGEINKRTHGQYRLTLTNFQEYANKHGKHHARQIDSNLVKDFNTYALSDLEPSSKSNHMSKLKHFLVDAMDRGWIDKFVKLPKVKTRKRQVVPFEDDEVKRILEEAGRLNGGTKGYATNPALFRLLLELMRNTGMRVSDAVRFRPKMAHRSESMWTYTFIPFKLEDGDDPNPVDAFITDDFMARLKACKGFTSEHPFAYRPIARKGETDYMAQAVYERMQEIGKRCKDSDGNPAPVEDCRPHRLRHTFAVRLLEKGWPIEDVSRLLGHASVAITVKYYAFWTKGRKLNLERRMLETLVNA